MVFSAVSYAFTDLVDKQGSCTTSSSKEYICTFEYRCIGCVGFVNHLSILSVLQFSSNDNLMGIKCTELLAGFDFQHYFLYM